jgi:hypothetical protein
VESDPESGTFEVFRRAVEGHDEQAWEELHTMFDGRVLAWCGIAAAGRAVDAEQAVSLTWEKFRIFFTPAKLASVRGTPGALRFLRLCARSAAFDIAR